MKAVANQDSRPVVMTVGHSPRLAANFIALLTAHAVTQLVDVRTVSRSRHNPQFNGETLPIALEVAGIRYAHVGGAGGIPSPVPDSPNAGWRNASVRGRSLALPPLIDCRRFGRS